MSGRNRPRRPLTAPYGRSRACSAGPHQQGQLDGLCGVYAAVNAAALLAARGRPVARRRCVKLFGHGVAVVAAAGQLEQVLLHGMRPELWRQVVDSVVAQAADLLGLRIAVDRHFASCPHAGFGHVRSVIEAALDRQALVLALLGGRHNHYTVITAHTPRRFLLYDSDGLHWLDKARCGTQRSHQRHRIVADALLVLDAVV